MKVTIAGKALVLTSSLKLEDLKAVAKYRPDALLVKGGKDNEETLFRVRVGAVGSVDKYGITFSEASRGEEGGLAQVTLLLDYDGDKVEEVVVDQIGGAMAYLKQVEETLPGVVDAINATQAELKAAITVQQ